MAESQRRDEDAAGADRGLGDLRAGAARIRARRPGDATRTAAREVVAQRGAPRGRGRRLRPLAPAGARRSPPRAGARDAQTPSLGPRYADATPAALRRIPHRRRATERGVGREPRRPGSRSLLVGAAARFAAAGAGRPRRPDRCARCRGEPAALARRALVGATRRRADSRARGGAQPARPTHRSRQSAEEHARRATRGPGGGRVSRPADALVAQRADVHGSHERVRAQGVQGGTIRGAGRGQPARRRGLRRASGSTGDRRLRRRGRQGAGARRRNGESRQDRRVRSRRAPARGIPPARTARRRAQLGIPRGPGRACR